MKLLLLASALALFAPSTVAQSTTLHRVQGTGDQVIPGPGAAAPRNVSLSLAVTSDATGNRLFAAGFAGGVPGVTEVAIHGPATATTTGPVLLQLQFTQEPGSEFTAINTFDVNLSSTAQDLIRAGATYLEVRSTGFPQGALRGAIFTNSTLCTAAFDQANPCGICPCGNGPMVQTQGGCVNSEGRSAELSAIGVPAVSDDSLDFALRQSTSNSLALLISGSSVLPLSPGPCPSGSGVAGNLTDGLRCVGGQVTRHGVRSTSVSGTALFGASTPQGGLLAANAFMAGQTRAFQVFYRDVTASPCGTGLNTTNGVLLQFVR